MTVFSDFQSGSSWGPSHRAIAGPALSCLILLGIGTRPIEAEPNADLHARSDRHFELTVVGPDDKPVSSIPIEFRINPKDADSHTTGGTADLDGSSVVAKTNANGRATIELPLDLKRLVYLIEAPGFAHLRMSRETGRRPRGLPRRRSGHPRTRLVGGRNHCRRPRQTGRGRSSLSDRDRRYFLGGAGN